MLGTSWISKFGAQGRDKDKRYKAEVFSMSKAREAVGLDKISPGLANVKGSEDEVEPVKEVE